LSTIGQAIMDLIMNQLKVGMNVLGGLGQAVFDIVTGMADSKNRNGIFGNNIGGDQNNLSLNPMSWGASLAKGLGFNDFISRPGGGISNFSPDDTVIGVKNTNDLFGGNSGSKSSGNNVNISMNVTINAMDGNEMKRKFDEIIRDTMRKYA